MHVRRLLLYVIDLGVEGQDSGDSNFRCYGGRKSGFVVSFVVRRPLANRPHPF
jgi:hypothetical protein